MHTFRSTQRNIIKNRLRLPRKADTHINGCVEPSEYFPIYIHLLAWIHSLTEIFQNHRAGRRILPGGDASSVSLRGVRQIPGPRVGLVNEVNFIQV